MSKYLSRANEKINNEKTAISKDGIKVNSANDAIQGQIARRHDGVFVDPSTGNTVAVQGPEMPPVLSGDRTPNNTGTADHLNAPQTAREWLTQSFEEQFGDLGDLGDRGGHETWHAHVRGHVHAHARELAPHPA